MIPEYRRSESLRCEIARFPRLSVEMHRRRTRVQGHWIQRQAGPRSIRGTAFRDIMRLPVQTEINHSGYRARTFVLFCKMDGDRARNNSSPASDWLPGTREVRAKVSFTTMEAIAEGPRFNQAASIRAFSSATWYPLSIERKEVAHGTKILS